MKYLLILLFLVFGNLSFAQSRYFVYLKDKTGSAFKTTEANKFLSARSIQRRTIQKIGITNRDLPVSVTYLKQLTDLGIKVFGSSKWLNAVLLDATPTQLTAIKALSFVKSVEGNSSINGLRVAGPLKNKWQLSTEIDYDYGTALVQNQQLGADIMHKQNITGKGILVGVFDSGFDRANTIDVLKPIFTEKRVLDTYDFVGRKTNVYNEDGHGTAVLSCIGGLSPGKLIGTAPDASFVLYRTEDVATESKLEEVYWLFAAEKADSIGVDVINSSLGYTTFDNPASSYAYADMNGDKTICARAADFAVGVGILVVVSAGNDGNSAWKFIATPADADSVISVGAVDAFGNIAGFSSFGPNAKNAIKPELVARGASTVVGSGSNAIGASNGTSFSSPVLAGFVASFKQAYPQIPAMKLREILIKSANMYLTPNARVGYGMPSYTKAKELAEEFLKKIPLATSSEDKESLLIYPNPLADEGITLKINNIEVTSSDIIQVSEKSTGRLLLKQTYAEIKNSIKKLPSGAYILQFSTSEGKNYTNSFIKL